MATPEKKEEPKKVIPLLELPKCSKTVAAPPSPDNYGPIVKVTVGRQDDRREFYAYSGLLAHYSSYFKAALKDCWGTPETVDLEDDNPEVFKAFFYLINTGKGCFTPNTLETVPQSAQLLCEIWVFGDARGAPELCNSAINLLVQKMQQEWSFPVGTISYIYDHTLPGSSLRKVYVDFALNCYHFERLRDPIERTEGLVPFPKEFLGDVLAAMMALGSTSIPSKAGWGKLTYSDVNWGKYIKPLVCSRYHDHPSPPEA